MAHIFLTSYICTDATGSPDSFSAAGISAVTILGFEMDQSLVLFPHTGSGFESRLGAILRAVGLFVRFSLFHP